MRRKIAKTFSCLEQMVDDAITGTFCESDYDETRLSRLETKWMHFLGTAAVNQAKLEQEQENMKSLVADISHQIKTPMTNIRLYASLLEETLKGSPATGSDAGYTQYSAESLAMLEEILRQADKMEFLIQALTKMSRLESGLVSVVPQKQELAVLLSEAAAEAEPAAKQKHITIQNTYAGGSFAYFDLKWTKEALANVLDNAVKYSREGAKVVLSVREYQMYMAVSVRDWGIGIREDDLPKIFTRFYRAPEVQQEEGVGIGLYLAREILKKERGYIKVNSSPDGTEFLLYLYRY